MRITNHIRAAIESALIAHAFGERQKEMLKRENELALKLYRCRVPADLERMVDRINERARELEITDGSFTHSISAVEVERAGMCDTDLRLSHCRPWVSQYYEPVVHLDDDHELTAEYEQFIQDRGDLKTEIDRARAEIDATLKDIHVARKLEAQWPEVMGIARPILEELGMEPKAQPLVVQTEQLNAVLGLPVEEANDDEKEQVAA